MIKKLSIPFVIACLAGLLISSVALAQSHPPQAQGHAGRRAVAQVNAVGEKSFTVRDRQGNERTLAVDDQTRFRTSDGGEASFADLKPEQWVVILAQHQGQEGWVVRLVAFLPEGLDPTQPFSIRARGQVTAVDTAAQTFQMHAMRGDDLTFQVGAGTYFLGPVQALDQMQVGMQVAVAGKQAEDGSLEAIVVRAHFPTEKHAGKVTAVDVNAGTFRLHTLAGQDLGFRVDENTRFIGRQGELKSLADLQEGMLAAVSAVKEEAGASTQPRLALTVAAAKRDQLPQFDLHVLGRLQSLSEDSLTLLARNGQTYTFLVTPETRFRSRGAWLQSLDDLRLGMPVAVGANLLADGQYQAQLILAARR